MARESTARKNERRALVTGASAGIGEAFAERLARDGWNLCIVARRRERLEELARALRKRHGIRVDVVVADLTDAADLHRLERRVARDASMELLVNNAGIADFGRFIDRDREREEAEIRLNVLAVVRLTHAVLPGMVRRQRGAVINVSSAAALLPGPFIAVYSACKAFLNTFTEALHFELDATGVRVQVLCPGLTRTEIFESAGADASSLPDFMWMSASAVVDESLAALERGTVVCIPGFTTQALTSLSGLLPHEASGRIAQFLTERSIKPLPSRTDARRGRRRPSP
jgi:short-subunit dehydrogenase